MTPNRGMGPREALFCQITLTSCCILVLTFLGTARFVQHTYYFHPLESRGNYSATSNNLKLIHWPLTGGLLHLVQRGGDWTRPQPAQAPPRCTKCNSQPINATTSVPITVSLYNGPLLCGFNVGMKGLTCSSSLDC